MTGDTFQRLAFAEAGPNEAGKMLEALEPNISFFIDRHEDIPMQMDVSMRLLSQSYVTAQWLAGVATLREKQHAARDGNDDLCLLVSTSGQPIHMRMTGRCHGRDEYVIRPDTPAQLKGNEEPYHAYSRGCLSQVICVPRARVVAAIPNLDSAFYRGVPQSAALTLLTGYAKALSSDIGPMDSQTLLGARDTLSDLFILALGPTRDVAEVANASARVARLQRIKADIAANLANPDLSLGWLAGRHALRPRAIQDLFYAAGESFTNHVHACRLDHAHALLLNPANAARNIAEIAQRSGFGDISWFNNAFRKRFGMTPGEVRVQALGGA